MAAYNWELVRDLGLAERRLAEARRVSSDVSTAEADVQRIKLEIGAGQASCTHIPNPEKPERCYKCGYTASQARQAEPRPLARTSPLQVVIRQRIA